VIDVQVEDGDYEAGIAVSEKTIAHEVDDGTKTGFAGRIKRLKKKMAASEQTAQEQVLPEWAYRRTMGWDLGRRSRGIGIYFR
jgi:hypothetical protein